MMRLHIRPVQIETDLTPLAALMNATQMERSGRQEMTEETLLESEFRLAEGEISHPLVAYDAAGTLCGYGETGRRQYNPPGQYRMSVLVAPEVRKQGVGRALYEALAAFAAEQGATRLTTEVREDCEAGVRSATRRGFTLERHTFSSTLDIATFEPAPFDFEPGCEQPGKGACG